MHLPARMGTKPVWSTLAALTWVAACANGSDLDGLGSIEITGTGDGGGATSGTGGAGAASGAAGSEWMGTGGSNACGTNLDQEGCPCVSNDPPRPCYPGLADQAGK